MFCYGLLFAHILIHTLGIEGDGKKTQLKSFIDCLC